MKANIGPKRKLRSIPIWLITGFDAMVMALFLVQLNAFPIFPNPLKKIFCIRTA